VGDGSIGDSLIEKNDPIYCMVLGHFLDLLINSRDQHHALPQFYGCG
jgi:hypothetical protein